jgi:hypothetical protein
LHAARKCLAYSGLHDDRGPKQGLRPPRRQSSILMCG